MRLVSFLAPSSQQAMAELRSNLGDDAIIISTQTLSGGQVRVTGAVTEEIGNLADVLASPEEVPDFDWLTRLGEFHEWPLDLREQVGDLVKGIKQCHPEFLLAALLNVQFSFDSLEPRGQTGRRPLLFSGLPGSGKSITIAKIAARQVLAGRTVDILTLDAKRAGAVAQLSTLLAPLDMKPHPISEISEMRSLLARCRSDTVLVDSPGINPFASSELAFLSNMLAMANADLVLVLPAGLGYADCKEMAQSYASLGATCMVVTKLDAAKRLGGVMAAAEAGLAFSEGGIGPTIGDGLHSLSPDGLARLLLRRYRKSIGEELR